MLKQRFKIVGSEVGFSRLRNQIEQAAFRLLLNDAFVSKPLFEARAG